MSKPIGDLIDELHAIREDVRASKKIWDAHKKAYDAKEQEIRVAMENQKTTTGKGSKASASITEQEIATLDDWDTFFQYVEENDANHLLTHGVASRVALEELEATGQEIPGITVITKTKLGLRST